MRHATLRSILVPVLLCSAALAAPWCLAARGPEAATPAGMWLVPATATVHTPDALWLELWVSCAENADSASAVLWFNPNYLRIETVVPELSAFETVLRHQVDNATGTLWYDAGSLTCHRTGTCPSGALLLARVLLRSVARTWPDTVVAVSGRVAWIGTPLFSGAGEGTTITVHASAHLTHLALLVRGAPMMSDPTPAAALPMMATCSKRRLPVGAVRLLEGSQ